MSVRLSVSCAIVTMKSGRSTCFARGTVLVLNISYVNGLSYEKYYYNTA